jgi:hypothetical protein
MLLLSGCVGIPLDSSRTDGLEDNELAIINGYTRSEIFDRWQMETMIWKITAESGEVLYEAVVYGKTALKNAKLLPGKYSLQVLCGNGIIHATPSIVTILEKGTEYELYCSSITRKDIFNQDKVIALKVHIRDMSIVP